MNPRILTTLLLTLLSQGVAFAVSPLVTDDADTVDPEKLQLNCDSFVVRTSSTSLYYVPINPVLGLTPRLELGAIFGYQWRGGSGSTPTTSIFSIRRFFGHDERFYDLLEASAQRTDRTVHHLSKRI